MVHDIDQEEKRRKKNRERQEEKLKKKGSPPANKSRVPFDTMLGLDKEYTPFEHKEIESKPKQQFERRERQKEHDAL